MTDYVRTLVSLVPDARISYAGVSPSYEDIAWLDPRDQPTKEKCDAAWPEIDAAIKSAENQRTENVKSAKEKLLALGLTADEIAVIFQ